MDGKAAAKKHLREIGAQARRLDACAYKIKEKRAQMMYPVMKYQEIRGSKRTDGFAQGMASLVDMQREYADQLLQSEILRTRLLEQLLSLDDARQIRLLYEYYFNGLSLAKISGIIGLNMENTVRCHSAALSEYYSRFLAAETAYKA